VVKITIKKEKKKAGRLKKGISLNVLELLKQKGVEPKKAAGTKGGEYHSPCPGCGVARYGLGW